MPLSRRTCGAVTLGVAQLAVILVSAACGGESASSGGKDDQSRPIAPSPIPTAALTPNPRTPTIPEGVMPIEEVAARPPADPEVRYQRDDGMDLPSHLSPCRTALDSDRDRIAGRQVVAAPTRREQVNGRSRIWKSQRLVIYRNATAAQRSLAELRDALTRCATHDEGGGVTTRWQSEALPIGEEALFVGGQMYRGETGLHGHYRGVVMRQGLAVVTYLDFGPMTEPPALSETEEQQKDARVMATRLASATWLPSGT